MRRLLTAIAATPLLAGLTVTPATAATIHAFELASSRLVAKGAVGLTFNIDCEGEFEDMHFAHFRITVNVTQHVGKRTVSGSATSTASDIPEDWPACNQADRVTVRVYPASGKRPAFRPKKAVISARLESCDIFSCDAVASNDVVHLSKKGR
jgi:hypothetical protein